MKYDIVIGLEIHAELNTKTKAFCSCKNEFSTDANANICPICTAMPGNAKPSLSRAAVEKTIQAGLATECSINDFAVFERKHYFYPDLASGFQKSQLLKPICINGGITLKSGKRIRINRIHLEEDAGKLLHDAVAGETLCDFNRCGAPLIEMVTEPDISNADEAIEFLREIRSRYVFSGVANCRMNEGGMRCDVNLSLKPKGSVKFGVRVEMKNINSFDMVGRAIEFEANRQAELLDAGKKPVQETRRWNEASCKSTSMRTKEQAHDYFYFPDPDITPIKIAASDIERLKNVMSPLAHDFKAKFTGEFGLPAYDSDVLTREKSVTDFFLQSVVLLNEPKKLSNWLMTNILAKSIAGNIEISPKQFTDIIKMTDTRKITRQNALVLIDELWGKPNSDAEITAKNIKIFGSISGEEIRKIVDELFEKNPAAVSDYSKLPDKVVNFFMGQVMKNTAGMADSIVTKEIILSKFN